MDKNASDWERYLRLRQSVRDNNKHAAALLGRLFAEDRSGEIQLTDDEFETAVKAVEVFAPDGGDFGGFARGLRNQRETNKRNRRN